METQDITRLERMLLDSVRSYLYGCESGTNDVLSEGLRDICSKMARLLECLLLRDENWNEYWWVDDVLPTAVPVLLDHQLQLQGLMIWSQKGTSKEWVEPCLMRVSENVDVFSYEILCGDALRGLGEVTYEQRRMNGALPEQWGFVF